VRELAKYSRAPLGSTYHYFPGGKYELAAEAVRWADDLTAAALSKELRAGSLVGLRAFVAMWRMILVDSDFSAGCPVLAASVEDLADNDAAPREAAASAFRNWTAILTASLRDCGATDLDAEQTATLIVAALEGAVAMCRAERSSAPLDRVVAKLEQLVGDVIGSMDAPAP
jgi:AcrR family transcriptional regulator